MKGTSTPLKHLPEVLDQAEAITDIRAEEALSWIAVTAEENFWLPAVGNG